MIENKKLSMLVSEKGYVSDFQIKGDPYKMNWVIDGSYLKETGYKDLDKLFGNFDLTADGQKMISDQANIQTNEKGGKTEVIYDFPILRVKMTYDLEQNENELHWNIQLNNKTMKPFANSLKKLGIPFPTI